MGLTFTQVPNDVQKALQKNAGVLLTTFDPTAVIDDTYKKTMRGNILMATNGGFQFTDSISWKDGADGIDNMPAGTMEMMEVESREVKGSGTGKSVSSDALLRLMATAKKTTDTTDSELEIYTPTDVVDTSMFEELWYVCDYGTDGGFIAIKMMNTLNRDGFSMQTANKDKGDFAFAFQAHYSIENINTVPYVIYKRDSAKAE